LNPEQGFFATANQYNVPQGYPHLLGLQWSDPCRYLRIQEFLSSKKRLTMKDMKNLQQDYLSLPARALVPLLRGLRSADARAQKALDMLLAWDYILDKDSVEAAIYSSWVDRLSRNVWDLYLPQEARRAFPSRSLRKMIDFLLAPDEHFGSDPLSGRDALLVKCLEQGLSDLAERDELRKKLDVGPLPRGGNSTTVNNTSGGYNQTSGASFRIIADLSRWDNSLGTNSPGQSGNPDDPHYADLFEMWAKGEYFPVYFSRAKVESVAECIILLQPGK